MGYNGRADNTPYYLSAYSLAVKHGYRGTEEEWVRETDASRILAEQAKVDAEAAALSATEADASATAAAANANAAVRQIDDVKRVVTAAVIDAAEAKKEAETAAERAEAATATVAGYSAAAEDAANVARIAAASTADNVTATEEAKTEAETAATSAKEDAASAASKIDVIKNLVDVATTQAGRALNNANDAAESSEAAAASATTAAAKAADAAVSANVATTKATEAAASATTAAAKATVAATSASEASTSKMSAASYAAEANISANNAKTYSDSAEADANRAQEVKNSIPEDYTEMTENVSRLSESITDLSEVSNKVFEYKFVPFSSYETGNISLSNNTLIYSAFNGRLITKENVFITLEKGDIVFVPSNLQMAYYVKVNGTYIGGDWLTGEINIANDGEYAFIFREPSQSPITVDPKTFLDGFYIKQKNTPIAKIYANEENVDALAFGADAKFDKIGYIQSSNGAINASDSARHLGKISTKFVTEFFVKTRISSGGCAVAFYDENEAYMSDYSIRGNGSVQELVVQVPNGAYYFDCSQYNYPECEIKVYPYFDGIYAKKETIKPLLGKKVMFFGDSITAIDTRYRKWLVQNTGMQLVESFAVSGATLTNVEGTVMDGNPQFSSNNTVPNQVQKMLNGTYDAPNIVIISAGTNGANANFAKGYDATQFTSGDYYTDVEDCDLTGVSGAMRWMYEKIMLKYPNAQVFFASPIQASEYNRHFVVLETRRNAIVDVANRLSCCVIDAFYKSGIYGRYETYNQNGKYLEDGLHPNEVGGKLLAKCYQREIESQIHF